MVLIFKEMKLEEDEITVIIIGEAFGYKIPMKMSILQLAKIFAIDRVVGDECESTSFGSEELEDKCEETRELVRNFPNIKLWNNKIKFDYVSVTDNSNDRDSSDMKDKVVSIYAEDLVGWNNEGIKISFPKELYVKQLKEKKFDVFVKPFSLILKIKDDVEKS